MPNILTVIFIEQSMKELPPEVRSLNDQELIRKLKSRRDKLQKIAKKYYHFLSKEVDISATDNDDRFEIERMADGSVKVRYFVLRKSKGDLLKYERTFYPKETKELRLYGLRGDDSFLIRGANSSKIKIRFIGGEGKDTIENKTTTGKVFAYDEIGGIEIKGHKIKDKTSTDFNVNDYDRQGFTYNTNFPLLFFGSTLDDGFWFGGSIGWVNHGWRKSPYKSSQSFSASFAPGSRNAFQIEYNGHFPKVFGGALDFRPNILLNYPRYANFFGLGNNSINPDREIQFNWVRMQSAEVAPMFSVQTRDKTTQFNFGPVFQSHDIKNTSDRVSNDETLGFTDEEFERRTYLGGRTHLRIHFLDNPVLTGNGFDLNASLVYLNAPTKDEEVLEFESSLQFYLTLIKNPQIIYAASVGYNKSFGDLQFYQYPDLGNNNFLRGFRNNRFRGQSLFFFNNDLRLHLFNWNNPILPMDVGLVGGYDIGRVWLENENSDVWHNSQTVGLWMNILGLAIIQPYYSFTDEGNVFSLRLGFNF